MNSILIIEDDLTFSKILRAWFKRRAFESDSAATGVEARKKIVSSRPDVVICDLKLPGEDGISILSWIKQEYPQTIVIMMTGYADIQTAVTAMKLGAYDYIPKPFNPEELLIKINEAFSTTDARGNHNHAYHAASSLSFIRGEGALHQELYKHIELVAPTPLSVLITGESGVGKEHTARMIHTQSERADGPFIAVDCGVLSKELAASDFFGHVKGSFTGAIANKTGFFQSADKGTIFLDEIGNLPLDIQTQLLRALQEKKIKPVGTEKEIDVDVRVISATNEDIDAAIQSGTFRSDLYHRVAEFTVYVPSIRENRDETEQYLNFFLEESNKLMNKAVKNFAPEALEILCGYNWPGNFREMKNIVNRLVLLTTGDTINAEIIPTHFKTGVKQS